MTCFQNDKIVVPLDFSEFSMDALKAALQLAKEPSQIYIIHVLPNLSPLEPGMRWGELDDKKRAENAKKAIEAKLQETHKGDHNIEVRIGEPAKQISKYATELGAGLVVIPSHGRTGAAHVFIGSTAERVVRYCHCPVLVIRK